MYYSAMAVVSKAKESVRTKTGELSLPLPVRLWNLERSLRTIVEFLQHPRPTPASGNPDVAPTTNIEEIAGMLLGLSVSIEELYKMCQKKGLTNRTMTSVSLAGIRKQGDAMLEYGELIRIVLDERMEHLFSAGMEEYRRGETVGIEAIR